MKKVFRKERVLGTVTHVAGWSRQVSRESCRQQVGDKGAEWPSS